MGNGGGAFRRRHAAVRCHRREPMERRAHRVHEAGRYRLRAWLRSDPGGAATAAWPELSRAGGALHGSPRGRDCRCARALETHLPAAPDVHDRGGAADPRRLAALSLAWRCWIGWRNRGAALSQATGSADLVRLRRNGLGWRVVALGPAAARRRAKTCAQGSAATGGM